MTINEFQEQIRKIYYYKDNKRGVDGTFRWFVEEVGELAKALRNNDPMSLKEEFGDCMAWLVSLGNMAGVNMQEVVQKYVSGCPKCSKTPCLCNE